LLLLLLLLLKHVQETYGYVGFSGSFMTGRNNYAGALQGLHSLYSKNIHANANTDKNAVTHMHTKLLLTYMSLSTAAHKILNTLS